MIRRTIAATFFTWFLSAVIYVGIWGIKCIMFNQHFTPPENLAYSVIVVLTIAPIFAFFFTSHLSEKE